MRLSLLEWSCGLLVLLSSVGRGNSLPIESVPYKGAVDYAGYPATDPAKAYPPRPPAAAAAPIVLPFGFQPFSNPIPPNQLPPAASPGSPSDSSTLVGPASPGGRPLPQRQQTLNEAKNRPPTPFERPQPTIPPGHWHPSMGMSPRPPSPTGPFIPPGFSDSKSNTRKSKGTSGYEGDDEQGRLRKTKGMAAPGYGSDSDASTTVKGRKAGVPAINPKGRSTGAVKSPVLKTNAAAPNKRTKSHKATLAAGQAKSSPKERMKAKAVAAASSKALVKKSPMPKGRINGRQQNASSAKSGPAAKRRS